MAVTRWTAVVPVVVAGTAVPAGSTFPAAGADLRAVLARGMVRPAPRKTKAAS